MNQEVIDSLAIKGDLSLRVFGKDGKPLSDQFAAFANPETARSAIPVNPDGSLNLANNMVVNGGRQAVANLLGGRDAGTNNHVVTHVSWGIYDEAPRFTDTTLSPQPGLTTGGENEIAYNGTDRKKLISSVDWPVPFVTRFECLLGNDECNGYTLREMGLWTASGVLFARKTLVPIVKTSDLALSFTWNIRS